MNLSLIVRKLRLLFDKGFFHIFGSNVVNKVVSFAVSILIVRILTKDDYGILSYANNLYTIAILFSGLGILGGMFQFCAEIRPAEEKKSYYLYGALSGVAVNAILALVMIAVGFGIRMPIWEAGKYLAMLGPMTILDFMTEYCATVLRTKRLNKEFAALRNISTISSLLMTCLGAYVGGISGSIVGRYLSYALGLSYALVIFRCLGLSLRGAGLPTKDQKRCLWRFSLPTCASAMLNQMVLLIDVFVIGLVSQSALVVSSYKVATMLPEGFLFIPASLMLFVTPYFAEHNRDKKWFSQRSKQVLVATASLMVPLALVLIAFAPQCVSLLWGDQYLDAAPAFRIIAASLLFSPLRSVSIYLLTTLRKVKFNFIVSIATLIINIVSVALLAPAFGSVGAASATLISVMASAFISLRYFRRSVKAMPQSCA